MCRQQRVIYFLNKTHEVIAQALRQSTIAELSNNNFN